MSAPSERAPSPRQYEYAERVLAEAGAVLHQAVGVAYGETSDLTPANAFPAAPANLRAASPPILDEEQRARLAEAAGTLGFVRTDNLTLSEQGLTGATVHIEGGQYHKVAAELRLAVEDSAAMPARFVISASPHRKLTNAAEIETTARLQRELTGTPYAAAGKSEYEVVRDMLYALPGVRTYRHPRVLHASYHLHEGFGVSDEQSAQFVEIGTINGAPVILMQINRLERSDGTYTHQPGTAEVVRIIHSVTGREGDHTSPIVTVTSNLYRQSRLLDAAFAGLSFDRPVGVAAYGADLLREVRGEEPPGPGAQLPGELHVMAERADRLRNALAAWETYNAAGAEVTASPRQGLFWTFVRWFTRQGRR